MEEACLHRSKAMLESELRVEVLDAFTALTQVIQQLCAAIQTESQFISWVQDTENTLFPLCLSNAPREKASKAFSQLHYLDDQAPREIIVCAGFIGASADTLLLAQEVNVAKERFKKSILALKAAKISPTDESLSFQLEDIFAKSTLANFSLKKIGLARLHLKQCYRKIPVLNAVPQKISWTWAHTRAIKKITVAQATQMLLKKGNDIGIQLQLQKLAHLSPHEPLAIVQELAPHLRANLVFKENHTPQRLMIKGPVPILFPCFYDTPYPQFKPPTKKIGKDEKRHQRSDVRLDPIPFLPAIRAHRYLMFEVTEK